MSVELVDHGGGVWAAPGARIIDRAGRHMLPIGRDGFEPAAEASVLVDKTMLIADVLDSGYTATLFCRPRRFGKTLNMTMLKAFLETPPDGRSRAQLFEGTCVWEAEGGRYREHQGAYPVVHLSFRAAKGDSWEQAHGALRELVAAEARRHDYLLESPSMTRDDRDRLSRLIAGTSSDPELAGSLLFLTRCLRRHHGRGVVVLLDEYDAHITAAYSAPGGGYYREAVSFLRGWLTGALKDGGEALAFACLTGVQRISKESVFSDLNNLVVSTALDSLFDERYGFTDAEVEALSAYLGHRDRMAELREWYDGYRFGGTDVYNPWSVLNYLDRDCSADVYWGNTSGNAVIGDLVRGADEETLEQVYGLLEPDGVVWAPLDLGTVFPEEGLAGDALWSMLYLAGYLTTEDTALPNDSVSLRPLRIPNREIARLFRGEIVERFAAISGGRARVSRLHSALVAGDEQGVAAAIGRIARDSASSFDLVSENSCHMLLLGLLFGMSGYSDPVSNRERGLGRPDIRLSPESSPTSRHLVSRLRPLVTIELKFARDATDEELALLARDALGQIAERGYDEGPLPPEATGHIRWGIAFSGKRVAAACERVG